MHWSKGELYWKLMLKPSSNLWVKPQVLWTYWTPLVVVPVLVYILLPVTENLSFLNQQKGGKLHVCGQTWISRKGESYMYVAKLESAERGKVTCMWPNWNQQKGGKLHVCGQTGISRKGESYMYVAKLESAERGKVICKWPNWNQQKGGKLHVCGQTWISRKGESYMYVAKLESAQRGKVTCMWPNLNQQKGGKLHVCGQTGIQTSEPQDLQLDVLPTAQWIEPGLS